MSIIRNSAVALSVVSALALGATSASAGSGAHKADKAKQMSRAQVSQTTDANWNRQARDPVSGTLNATGQFVANVVGGTGAFIGSTVAGRPYGPDYYYGDPYANGARMRVGANAPAGFSGCATDDGYNRYRECEAGGTGG